MPGKDWKRIFLAEMKREIEKAPAVSEVHKKDHCLRVWERSKKIAKSLGGDLEVLLAASLLHDLGRHWGLEHHGPKSAKLAKPIMQRHKFPKGKMRKALVAIAQHDYDFARSKRKLLEAKILYDADKMDAFGSVGIRRHLAFIKQGRMKREEVLALLGKRWAGLMLAESRRCARKDYDKIRSYFMRQKSGVKPNG